jgi:hypothetical protein
LVKAIRRWPYKPPDGLDPKPLSDHWRPNGYVLLSEAVDTLGRATFGQEWTGNELKARPSGGASVEPPSDRPDGIIIEARAGINRLPPARPRSPWSVWTTQGVRQVDTEERAMATWQEERPKLLAMWRAEHGARQRHDEIVSKLRTDLYAGAVRAWVQRGNVGDLIEVPSSVWGRDGIESVFELGNHPGHWRNPNILAFVSRTGANNIAMTVKGRVMLSATDIDAYINRQITISGGSGSGTLAAETKCEQWIRLRPEDNPPANKNALWEEAAEKFGIQLSKRSFLRAWDNAAPETWRRAGAKKKTGRES